VHRTGDLYGHFQTLEQQKESATLGMWIFLVTEVLFFGGLFLAYTINRSAFSTAFGIGSNTLDITLGAGNTVVLIMSSLTMAMAVWSAQVGKKKLVSFFLIATLGLGTVFLGVKAIEYKQKFDHHLIPGRSFDMKYHPTHPMAGDDLKELALEKRKWIRRCRRSGHQLPWPALFLPLFRYDRPARSPHDRRRRPPRLAHQGFLPAVSRRTTTPCRNRRPVLALRRYCVDLSVPLLYLIDRHR